jgi:hypothetical protein
MAEWRKVDPSNEPETCLWCGRKLKWKTYKKDKPREMTWEEWLKTPESKESVRFHDKPGDYGDGVFCGLRCGYQFGVAMANFGRRIKPKQDWGTSDVQSGSESGTL